MTVFLAIMAAVFGTMIGSFLNALIYRIPINKNIVYPRSACPHCGHIISWYENIPVISYLFLRGRCSNCHEKISILYPVVELVTGLFAFSIAPDSINPADLMNFFFYLSIFSAFLVHFIVDLKHQILPDSINIYLGLLFFVTSVFVHPWTHWLLGGVIGLAFPLMVSWLFYMMKGQIGLGGGDIKLFAVLGIYLGPIGVLQNIFLSCLVGAIIGGLLILAKVFSRDKHIAFGPFIIAVASVQIFAQNWFNDLMRYIP